MTGHRRRFLNLVTANWATGVSSLRRLNLHSRQNNLFYPTPAAAEEAAAAAQDPSALFSDDANGRRRQVTLKKVPRIHLPAAPTHSFQHCHDSPAGGRRMACVALSETQTAFLLDPSYGRSRRRAFLYDSGERRVVTLPDLQASIYEPKCLAVAGGEHDDAVYVMETSLCRDIDREEEKMTSTILFQALIHRRLHYGDEWRCDELPPPPYVSSIGCHALVHGGSGGADVICISTGYVGSGTYCFDMASREWSKAGDWALPFYGKVEHDRDLGIWVGFLSCERDDALRLCATTDLFSDTERGRMMEISDEFWLSRRDGCKDLEPPCGWYMESGMHQLVGLGSGKFCLVQFFETREEACSSCQHEEVEDKFAVFTGVEVIRCGGSGGKDGNEQAAGDGSDKDETKGELRIVVHKSKRYMLTNINNGTLEFVL